MDFRILGPLEAGDPPVALGGGKPRALLAVLLLHAGRTVSRTRLIDDLWGEHVPDTAAKMVQIHVSQLRKVLPEGLLVTRPPGYALEVASAEVDLHRAERMLAEGRAALQAGDAHRAATTLAEALALWRGAALAEFEEPFARSEAGRIEELRLALTEERIDADLALARHGQVVGELEALIAQHPLRERLRGQLMQALYRSGRQAEALAAFQETRRVLDDELGLEPSPALREIERRILRHDPDLEALPVRIAPPTPAHPRRPDRAGPFIVGRDAELARLRGLADAALAGEARVVIVSGEAGLGKSALVEELLSGLVGAAAGAPVVARGQCVEHHGAREPYMPVLEALGRLCGPEGDPSLAPILAERAPMWIAQLPWLIGPGELTSPERRTAGANPGRMIREGVDALAALARARPAVVVLEDLHWSDSATLDLLAALARRRESVPLVVVGTLRLEDAASRDHPAHALVSELGERDLVVEVALGALGADDIARYVSERLPGVRLPASASAQLLARSRGNPLFLQKAVDAWVEAGHVREDDGVWRLEVDVGELAADVPGTLRELILGRVRQVPEEARSLIEAASVVGGDFSAALVAAAAAQPDEDAERGLERLARAGLILAPRGVERWPDGTIASRYGFVHDLYQEVLYGDLAGGRRARLHIRVADRLEEAFGDRGDEIAAQLASHLMRGGDEARAARYLVAAARRAAALQAPREAADTAQAGLRLLEHMGTGRERDEVELSLQSVLGPSLIGVEGWASEGAERALLRSRELADVLGRREEVVRALNSLATLYEFRGDYPRAELRLEESLSVLDGQQNPALEMDSNELLACTLFHQGAFERGLAAAERALASYDGPNRHLLAVGVGHDPGVASGMWAAYCLWFLGRADEAVARAAKTLELADRLGTAHARSLVNAQAALFGCMREDPEAARAHADAAVEHARPGGFPYREAVGWVARGWAMAATGDADDGIGELRRGIQLSRAIGARMNDTFFLALLADACTRAGLVLDALAALEEARAGEPREGRFFWGAELSRLQGELLAREGRAEEAEAELRRAIDVAAGQSSPVLEARAQAALARAAGGAPPPTTSSARAGG